MKNIIKIKFLYFYYNQNFMQFFQNHKIIEGNYALSQIEIQQNIGNGNSSVYSARINNRQVAIKQILIRNQDHAFNVHKQIQMMRKLSQLNQNIIHYEGYFITIQETGPYNKMMFAYIVMEKGITTLESFIQRRRKSNQRFKDQQIINIFGTIIKSLLLLQKNQFAHCDIKPENILIMNIENLQVKICDIGSCKSIEKQQTEWGTLVGTVPFLAPELVKNYNNQKACNNPYKSDVYSLGLCLVYVLNFKKFKSNQRLKIDQKLYKQIVNQWIKQCKQIKLYDCLICQLLDTMLQFDEKKRVKFSELQIVFDRNILIKTKQKNEQILWAQKKKQQQLGEKRFNVSLLQYNNSTISTSKQKDKSKEKQKLNKTGGFKIRKALKIEPIRTEKNIRQEIPKCKLVSKVSSPSPNKTNSPFSKKLSVVLNQSQSPVRSKKSSPQKIQMNHSLIIINKQMIAKYNNLIINWLDKYVTINTNFWEFELIRSLSIIVNENFNIFQNLEKLEKLNGLTSLIINMNKFKGNLDEILNERYYNYSQLEKLTISMKQSELNNSINIIKYFLHKKIKKINLHLSQSKIVAQDILQLTDYISSSECQKLILVLNKLNLDEKHNKSMMQSLSKTNISKLVIHLQENMINYSGLAGWPLPKTIISLTLNYKKNKISTALNSLCLSLPKTQIKQLNLNLSNCSLSGRQINFLFNTFSKLKTLETLILNLSYNRIDDSVIKYICSRTEDIFSNIVSFQLEIYGTEVTIDGWSKLLGASDKLFSNKMKMNHFKLSYDRFNLKSVLQNEVRSRILSDSIKIDILCVNNEYFSTYLRKKPTFQIKVGNKGFCSRLHSNYEKGNHYICLSCQEQKQIYKDKYFCQFCIVNCSHRMHNIIKCYQYVKCSCTFSGNCKTDLNQYICSHNFQEEFQKGFYCLKCNKQDICINCIQECQKDHDQFVKDYKQATYFLCKHEKIE